MSTHATKFATSLVFIKRPRNAQMKRFGKQEDHDFQTGNPSGTGSSFEILRNEKITRHQDGAQDEGMTQKPSFSSKEI